MTDTEHYSSFNKSSCDDCLCCVAVGTNTTGTGLAWWFSSSVLLATVCLELIDLQTWHESIIKVLFISLNFNVKCVFLCHAAFSELLFPALSCIAVGGIVLLLTNMQVNSNLIYHKKQSELQTKDTLNCPITHNYNCCIAELVCVFWKDGKPVRRSPLHHHHPLHRRLWFLC